MAEEQEDYEMLKIINDTVYRNGKQVLDHLETNEDLANAVLKKHKKNNDQPTRESMGRYVQKMKNENV